MTISRPNWGFLTSLSQKRRWDCCAYLQSWGLVAIYPAATASGNGTFEGVASCAGSTCHGRAEGNGAVVRQDEIATWQEPSSPSGAHSRAYAVLAGQRGRQIAASLGYPSATGAPQCLGCHATYVPRGEPAAVIAIRSLTGSAAKAVTALLTGWLSSHYARPATHASNVDRWPCPARQSSGPRECLS